MVIKRDPALPPRDKEGRGHKGSRQCCGGAGRWPGSLPGVQTLPGGVKDMTKDVAVIQMIVVTCNWVVKINKVVYPSRI